MRQNTHQTHFEDIILFGKEGLKELNDRLDFFEKKLLLGEDTQGTNISTKIDGAPSLLVWSSYWPFSSSKPGIALKGALTTENAKKLMFTPEDVQKYYGDRPDMVNKLIPLFDIVHSIPEDECWQGDVLFSADTVWEIENDLAFQPNKIVYRVPIDSDTGHKIAQADAGIAFHTRYKTDRHDGMTRQNFNVSVDMLENLPDNIFVMDANVKQLNVNLFTDEDKNKWNELREELDSYLSQLSNEFEDEYERLCYNQYFIKFLFMTFQNKNTSDKKSVTLKTDTFIADLQEFAENRINNEYEKKIAKLKTDAGRQNALNKKESELHDILDIIDNNSKILILIVEAINAAAQLKMLIWKVYKNTGVGFDTYLRTVDGYEPTANEGLAVSDNNGNILKVVDRTTFSNANRDPKYLSGFEHPQYRTKESTLRKDEKLLSGPDLLENRLNDILNENQLEELFLEWIDNGGESGYMFTVMEYTLHDIYYTFGFVRKTRNIELLKFIDDFLRKCGYRIKLLGHLESVKDLLK